jgi:hypothetical protein
LHEFSDRLNSHNPILPQRSAHELLSWAKTSEIVTLKL